MRWQLFWSDDGSSDESVAVMRAFSADCAPGQCNEINTGKTRAGVGGAYQSLIDTAPQAALVAFADQDDVWLPFKLARACAHLQDVRGPALYCARQFISDEGLQNQRPSSVLPSGRCIGLGHALTQNIAVGHTMVLNADAVAWLRACPIPKGALHDWWSYLIVNAVGGTLITDNLPVSLYRQHRFNAVGAAASVFVRGVRAFHRGPATFMRLFSRNVFALLKGLEGAQAGITTGLGRSNHPEFVRQSVMYLAALADVLRQSPLRRLWFLFTHRTLRRQGFLEQVVFVLWFVMYGGVAKATRPHARKQDLT